MNNEGIKHSKELIERVEQVLQGAYEGNKVFNGELNGPTPVKISSLMPGRDEYNLEASEILFWVDRDAYNDELTNWETTANLEKHKDAIEHLKRSDQLPVFYDLVSAIKKSRIAPFIGAGMSQASSFPLWGAALEQLITRIDGVDENAVKACLSAFDYLGAAQILWDKDSAQVKNFIRTRFAERQIPLGGVLGPIKLLPRFSRGCLITTNFDPVIELVIGRGNLEGYMHGMQQGNKFVPKLIKGDRCLLKLHGDAEDHDTYIFTKSQYDEGYGSPFDFKRPLPRALRQIYISHSLLFLGCSLEQDRTLELFQTVCDEKEFEIPDHFAILTESSNKNQKEGRLLPLKIRPIWYPAGKHEFVEHYLSLAVEMADDRIDVI